MIQVRQGYKEPEMFKTIIIAGAFAVTISTSAFALTPEEQLQAEQVAACNAINDHIKESRAHLEVTKRRARFAPGMLDDVASEDKTLKLYIQAMTLAAPFCRLEDKYPDTFNTKLLPKISPTPAAGP